MPAGEHVAGICLDGFGVDKLRFLYRNAADDDGIEGETSLLASPYVAHELGAKIPLVGPSGADTAAGRFLVPHYGTVIESAEHVEAAAIYEWLARGMLGKVSVDCKLLRRRTGGFERNGECILEGGLAVGGKIRLNVVGAGTVLFDVAPVLLSRTGLWIRAAAFDCFPHALPRLCGVFPVGNGEVAPGVLKGVVGELEGFGIRLAKDVDRAIIFLEGRGEHAAGMEVNGFGGRAQAHTELELKLSQARYGAGPHCAVDVDGERTFWCRHGCGLSDRL